MKSFNLNLLKKSKNRFIVKLTIGKGYIKRFILKIGIYDLDTNSIKLEREFKCVQYNKFFRKNQIKEMTDLILFNQE